MNNLRREKLRAFLEGKQSASFDQIKEHIPEVSIMTIHRDLDYLQNQGLIVKVRNGAYYNQTGLREPVFSAREIVNMKAKQVIAEKAIPLLSNYGSVFLDSGTTILAFAAAMPDIPANIITSGPNIALALCRLSSPNINLCGGIINKNNLMLTGSAALETLSGINIDVAFLATSGYNSDAGFSCGRESEAEIKRFASEKARSRIMLMDSSKIGKVFPHTFLKLDMLDVIVTEKDPSELPEELLRQAMAYPKLRIY